MRKPTPVFLWKLNLDKKTINYLRNIVFLFEIGDFIANNIHKDITTICKLPLTAQPKQGFKKF
jgi:hypothetical protein